MNNRLLAAPLLGLSLLAASAGVAATAAPALSQTVPYYAPYGYDAHDVRGTVSYFSGYVMTINTRKGQIEVQLHRGTVINPLGMTIRPGMHVTVHGDWSTNGWFYANRIGVR
jgi:hypothetical protein